MGYSSCGHKELDTTEQLTLFTKPTLVSVFWWERIYPDCHITMFIIFIFYEAEKEAPSFN